MNGKEFELDRKTDTIEHEAQSKSRVLRDGGVVGPDNVFNSDGNKGSSSGLIDSDENRASVDNVFDTSVNDTYRGSDEGTLEEIRVSAELENRATDSDVDGRFSAGVNKLEHSESGKTGFADSDIRNAGMTQKVNGHKSSAWNSMPEKLAPYSEEKVLAPVASRAGDHGADVLKDGIGNLGSMAGKGYVEVGKPGISQYESMISEFDEFARNGDGKAMGSGLSTSVGYGYEIGDMVWGKVKSHPWWPGHIYNEAFAWSSVRRTKRPGDVLVAFFGDSSYGWFDPAELIPFDPNFAEKSSQTNSRNFVKAVEEAIDEASRRRGLGLACRCRNPYNFRSTDVHGYFVVDVDDYEPGGLYSVSQIRKSRDSFQSRHTLAFIKQLALTPRGDGHGSIGFIKNKATVLAYRKAVFEEFDETYAQAFGAQPVRPTRVPMEAITQPVRAPLSGPLVIAEALGKRKHTTKPYKVKDQTNKEKYLFKRRDVSNELKIQQIGQTTSSMQPSYIEGSMELAAGDYVMQKRAQAVSTKQHIPPKLEPILETRMNSTLASNRDTTGAEVVAIEDKPVVARFSVASSLASGSKVEPLSGFACSFPVRQSPAGYNTIVGPTITENSGLLGKEAFHGGINGASDEGDTTNTRSKMVESFQQPPRLAAVVEEPHGQEQVHIPLIDGKSCSQDSKMRIDTGTKKAKLGKRPVGELVAEKSVPGEKKKKKKRKKELGLEMSSDSMQNRAAARKVDGPVGRVIGKSVQVGLPPKEDFQIEHRKKDDGDRSSVLPDSLGTRSSVGVGNFEFKLPQLLSDLQALALNPFHGLERNSPAVIRQAFLKFRSHVFQKSLALSTSAEMEFTEVRAPKPPASTTVSDYSPRENIKDLPSLKPPKSLVRPDDPTRAGRKRGPSDRQEELVAKRVKKINDTKSVAVEKASQRTPEAQRDGKETAASRPIKPLKSDSVKKNESPAKAPEPTTLVMKFPPNTALPSGSELKARLACFGLLDHSGIRIFWKSSTCRVVFIHRADAEAEHRHLTGKIHR